MKWLALLFLISGSQAFATCELSIDAQELARETEYFGHEERLMIMKTLKLEKWRVVKDEYSAVWTFQDHIYNERDTGPDAGVVIWYSVGDRVIAHVHFTRNSQNYGAYFEQIGKTYKLLAQIDRGQVTCL